MLTTILNSLPPPKTVVIQDSLTLRGKQILYSIIKQHLEITKYDIHFFAFETDPKRIKVIFPNDRVQVHDFISDNKGWLEESNAKNFPEYISKNNIGGIIIIDSLAQYILDNGLPEAYEYIGTLSNQPRVIQIVGILHEDTVPDKQTTLKHVDHIMQLTLKLTLVRNKNRVEYRYKKPSGKVTKKIEEYYFENKVFFTKDLEKVEPKITPSPVEEQLPENMSTFRISLDENEKLSREKLTLPYMNKSTLEQSGLTGGGNIIYNFDSDDDWDDEDPDDDLNI